MEKLLRANLAKKYFRGHRVKGAWVIGMVERSPQRTLIIMPVEKRDEIAL
ncbi:hypothetical protein ENBRE01_2249 [Enteropsectra breve]|nr:hypothetical protein ENBRE01_2249 [Enteropsectra breve]